MIACNAIQVIASTPESAGTPETVNIQTLKAILKAKGWSQTELARRIGVSRQAVSLWLRSDGSARVRGEHLLLVSRVLGVSVEELVRPLPAQGDEGEVERVALLWDALYPDLVEFAIAAGRFEPKAVGRLVEVFGLYAAARILGASVWNEFDDFKRFIHPARRRQLEMLVRWRRDRTAA